jgi:hypothetical protein
MDRVEPPKLPKLSLKNPQVKRKVSLRALKILVDKIDRKAQDEALQQAIASYRTYGLNKSRAKELQLASKRYSKGTGDLTAKELLEFLADTLTLPAVIEPALSPTRREQDDRNYKLIVDTIYGLHNAISLYESLQDEQDKAKHD